MIEPCTLALEIAVKEIETENRKRNSCTNRLFSGNNFLPKGPQDERGTTSTRKGWNPPYDFQIIPQGKRI